MKNIVVSDSFHQSDLKPSDFVQKYLDLLQEDIVRYLRVEGGYKETPCPACQGNGLADEFKRFGFHYKSCSSCGTLFVPARPSDEVINKFYRQASACQFWQKEVLPATQSKRDQKIINPRVNWILDSVSEYLPHAVTWVDVHTSQPQFLQAMADTAVFTHKITLNPYVDVKSISKSVEVKDTPWWQATMEGDVDVVTLFETLDQASDPAGLLSKARRMLKKDGLCFLTAILSSGFDVKELGAYARNIYPPDRLNVFSVKGLKMLLEQNGFECLELSTPGVLDVEIVADAIKAEGKIPVSPFVRELVLNANEKVKLSFQEFLQANLLSSYGRILVRKI